jgi:hypothetical protein
LFSKAKEEVFSYAYWFRKKYNLTPNDPRFLEMTLDEIKEEFFLDRLSENPEFKLESLTHDTTADEEWMLAQEKEQIDETLKKVFEGKLKPNTEDKSSKLDKIEAVRNKVKVSVKPKLIPKIESLGGDDGDFETVFKERS